MRKKLGILLVITALLIYLLPTIVLATNHQIFGNIQQAQQQYLQTIQNVSLFVAFLGGILSFLTPCAIGILPAYFAYTFQEKKELVKMTLLFFLGLMVIFIPIGLAASFIGNLLIIYRESLAIFAGILLFIFGVLVLLGKGFSILPIKKQVQKNALGIFLFGILFGIGFTPCNGPILLAITTLASTQTTFYAIGMFILYGVGIATPLLILSYFFDRSRLIENLAKKGHFKVNIMGREFRTHWTGIVAGILFIVLGAIFIILRNTVIFTITAAKLGYPLRWAYSLQEEMIKSPVLANALAIIGITILAIIVYLTYKSYKKRV